MLSGAAALAGLVLTAGPAAAHASLVNTDPADGAVLATAPDVARLRFDEPVRVPGGGVHLFDAAGAELASSAHTSDAMLVVEFPDHLADGTYVVAWRIISADGHPVAGALTFSIGAPSTAVAPSNREPHAAPMSVRAAVGVLQALVYVGTFTATGLAVFLLLLLPSARGLDLLRDRLADTARFSGAIAILTSAALVPTTELYQRGTGFAGLGDRATWSGALTGQEAVAALILVLGLTATVRLTEDGAVTPRRRGTALACAVAALSSLALVGHTRSVGPRTLMVSADITHVLAGSVWVGGLLGLALVVRRLGGRPQLAATALTRFSILAAWLLGLVALTGSVIAWRILRSWSALVETDFGRLLLVKLSIVAAVVLVAAWNRYRLLPRVTDDVGFVARRNASGVLRRTLVVESALLAAVLAVTGFLVDRSPVESTLNAAPAGALDSNTFVGQVAGLEAVATIRPARVGANTLLVQIQDAAGDPLEPYAIPEISLSQGDLSLGALALEAVDSSTFTASVVLPRPGTWTLNISVRTSEFDNPVVLVRIPVS